MKRWGLLFAFGPAVLLLYERRYRKIMEGRET